MFGMVLWTFFVVYSKVSRGHLSPVKLHLPLFLFGLLLVLISDLVSRRFGFFQGLGVRAEVFYFGLPLLLLTLFYSKNGSVFHKKFLSVWLLLFMQAVLTVVFVSYADGRLLFSDDHPSFLYRLHLLAEHFPFIPFYNTDWNAGYSAREFFPSGSLFCNFSSWPGIRRCSLRTAAHRDVAGPAVPDPSGLFP